MSSFSTAEKQLMTVISFGYFMSHFNMLTFPALALPLSAGLDLPLADVMGLSFPMYLLFGLTALPWGMIGDRWRSDRLMVLFFLGAGLGGAAVPGGGVGGGGPPGGGRTGGGDSLRWRRGRRSREVSRP